MAASALDGYRALLRSEGQLARLMAHSLALSLLTASVSTPVGVALGALLGKTDLPLRGSLTLLFTVPLLLPPYVLAVAWFSILSRTGLLAAVLPDFVVAKNLLGIFWTTWLCVCPCDGVHADRHASDDCLSTNCESAARVCGKAGQPVVKHPAPNNAAAHGAGNLVRRRTHISSVDRRD